MTDLHDVIRVAEAMLYAEDLKLSKTFNSIDNRLDLQAEIDVVFK